jgi:hypothetical protein
VVLRTTVLDGTTGLPLEGATVDLLITGPEGLTVTTGQSDAAGVAEGSWNTKSGGKNRPGTTPGDYTAAVAGVTANGYEWDGVTTSVSFTIQ